MCACVCLGTSQMYLHDFYLVNTQILNFSVASLKEDLTPVAGDMKCFPGLDESHHNPNDAELHTPV